MKTFRCIQRIQCIGFVFVTLTVLCSQCSSASVTLNAVIENNFIDTEINKTENLLCSIPDERIKICLWTHSDFGKPKEILNMFEFLKGNVSKGNFNFIYYGKGLQNGECGMQVSKMEKQYLGFWNCSLISESNQFFMGSIQVKLSAKNLKPTLERSALENLLIDGTTGVVPRRDISCCVNAYPRPTPPKITFLLDQVPLDENFYNIGTTENGDLVCRIWFDTQLKPENNGKQLQCTVQQQNKTSDEILTDSVHLNIKYAPVFHPDQEAILQSIPSDEKTVNISIEFSGNPAPDMSWHIKKNGDSETFFTVLDNGSKYNVQKRFIEGDRWVAELIIKELQKRDVEYEYILNVTNQYGFKIITVTIEDYVDLSNWLIIVGAVLLVVFAIVTISLLVWATKTRRLCCRKSARLPITRTKPAPAPVRKYSGTSYKRAPIEDTVPDSSDENAVSANPKTCSSLVTEIP